MYHRPILDWKCDRFYLVSTANKSSRNHTAMDFQTGDDALPGMTSCYISTAYKGFSL